MRRNASANRRWTDAELRAADSTTFGSGTNWNQIRGGVDVGSTTSHALRAGLVDEVHVYVVPAP